MAKNLSLSGFLWNGKQWADSFGKKSFTVKEGVSSVTSIKGVKGLADEGMELLLTVKVFLILILTLLKHLLLTLTLHPHLL